MVFSSLLFVYLFLPLNLLFYAGFSDIRKKNICVLVFSLIFYAWTSLKYLILLMLMALVSYIGARLIGHFRETRKAAWILAADLAISLGVLGYFKYLGFFCNVVNSFTNLFEQIPSMLLPVGISFYTFQLISYVVDVYRGDIEADCKYTNILLYTALFHQCIAGPIVRYKDIAQALKERKTDINAMNDGISSFCVGLAKKTLLADSCAAILEQMLPQTMNGITHATAAAVWTGGLLYMLQIYLDFSAYSDMAIGLGKMTGFHYKENFNYPYTAVSVTDFWRRWHISLSTFFKDYVYIPLGGNRKGLLRQLLNMFIVWVLTGLWHGAAYNFVLWGLYFFLFLAIEKLVLLKFFAWLPAVLSAVVSRLYTLAVVFFGWILFRFEDMEQAAAVIKGLFGLNGNAFTSLETNTLLLNNIVFIAVCLIAATPAVKKTAEKLKGLARENSMAYLRIYNALNIVIPVILLFISTIALIGNSYNPFIYFRF